MNNQQPMQQQYSVLNRIKKAGAGDVWLKVLLSGEDGAGKSTSVIFGAEKPLLVIDPEAKAAAYGHLTEFDLYDSQNVLEILQVTRELLQLQMSGQQLPYRTVLIDSGTVLYNYIKKFFLDKMRASGSVDKYKLEFNEYDAPKDMFYEIINNLKKLNVHFFITSHVKENYLRDQVMKINPNEPWKADVEKRLPYEVHVHMMLQKKGKNKFKAERKRSNLLDKNRNHLIPAVIDDFDNNTLVSMIIDYAKKDKGFIENKPEIQNVIRTDAELSNMIDEIIEIVNAHLRMPPADAARVISQVTNGRTQTPFQLTKEEAFNALGAFRQIRDGQMTTGE